MINPIECLFSKIKEDVRMEPENIIYLCLTDVISPALSYIRAVNLMGWYRSILRNRSLEINMADFY